jgi:hypothetical protein
VGSAFRRTNPAKAGSHRSSRRTPRTITCADAADGRSDQRFNTARARDSGKADFHERRPRRRERPRRALNCGFVGRIADCSRDEARACNHRVNLAQDLDRHGTERAGQRVFRIDDIGAARKRSRRLLGTRDADEQSHRESLIAHRARQP